MNNWMFKYLPAPLLGKSGHGLHHACKYTSNCEEPRGKQAAHIRHLQQQDQSILLRLSESTQKVLKIWPCLPASPPSYVSSCSSDPSHTHFLCLKPQVGYFFCNCSPSAWRAPKFSANSSHITNVTSSDFPKLLSQASRLLSYIYSLSHPSLAFFSLHLSKIFLLSPETGFIYLAQIIQSWVITWTVGGELKTCLQVHPLQKRGCVAWSRISFVNWGYGFWNPKLSLQTQLAVYSETTLLVLSSSA